MKKIVAVLITALMFIQILVPSIYAIDNKFIDQYSAGDIITYGTYPQTKVSTKSLINELNQIEAEWISYNYYTTNKQCDFMMYKDVTLNSNKYRAVKFTKYRDFYTTNTYTLDTYTQEENNYHLDTVYWFKYEPIKWRVLSPETGLVICESIIDSQHFYFKSNDRKPSGNTIIYPNNWAYSDIRTWLNSSFFDTAFTEEEKDTIDTTELKNDAYRAETSRFNAENTFDKIYLLSLDEITKNEYGYESTTWNSESRCMSGTDYALCQGLRVHENGYSFWRLRNAGDAYIDTCYINNNGARLGSGDSRSVVYGVVPVMNIKADTFINQSTTDNNDNAFEKCKCNCHKTGIMSFFWKIQRFFWKLFSPSKKQICDCGIKHW